MTLTLENVPEELYHRLDRFAAEADTSIRTAAMFFLLRSVYGPYERVALPSEVGPAAPARP